MPLMLRRGCLLFSLVLSIAPCLAFQAGPKPNLGNPSTIEDFKAGDANRESGQRATDVLAALQLKPGNWAADFGAGGRYYSMRIADVVGPRGKVFAEDISDSSTQWLNLRVSLFHLRNVEVVKGAEDDG